MSGGMHTLAIFQNIGTPELIVIGIVALLIFGRRLPEVGRSLGRSFVEFKKGLKDTGNDLKQIKDDADEATSDRQLESDKQPTKEKDASARFSTDTSDAKKKGAEVNNAKS